MTNSQFFFVSLFLGIITGSVMAVAINVKAIKEHTEIFTTYKAEMDELALDVWCKPLKDAQEQVNCIRDNIYLKAK